MPKYNLSGKIKDFNGNDIPELGPTGAPTSEVMTVRGIVFCALNHVQKGDDQMSIVTKSALAKLGWSAAASDIIEISPENVAILRARINALPFSIAVTSQACEALETPIIED